MELGGVFFVFVYCRRIFCRMHGWEWWVLQPPAPHADGLILLCFNWWERLYGFVSVLRRMTLNGKVQPFLKGRDGGRWGRGNKGGRVRRELYSTYDIDTVVVGSRVECRLNLIQWMRLQWLCRAWSLIKIAWAYALLSYMPEPGCLLAKKMVQGRFF